MVKRLCLVTVLVFVLLAGFTFAQDEEWTCDEGPNDILNAAKAAFEAGDKEKAWNLAAQAEVVCLDNAKRLTRARGYRSKLDGDPDIATFDRGTRKVNIGDYALSVTCIGEGSPTVIFENGLAEDPRYAWALLPAVSTATRACSYARLGTYLSDDIPGGAVRTTQDQVDDLIALLGAADIEPPYVLAGHSIAGFNILLFVDQYPDLVEGVVLVDAVHPDYFERLAETDPDYEAPVAGETDQYEQFDWATSVAQVAGIRDFEDRPLAVLTAGIDSDEIWMELEEEYATYSTNSRHVIAENCRHRFSGSVTRSAQTEIIQAVLWVLDEIKASEEAGS